jgi:hypothetical protein
VFDFHSEDFFPEEVPPHLSQRSRREIHHEADPSWPLLHRKPLRNEPENGGMNATTIPPKYVRQQFIVVQFGIGFGDDARHHFLVVADDGGVLDEGVHHDHLLEFTRRHLEPLDGDQFGDSALDEHPSATVVPRNVSGFEVAILHDRLGGVHVLEVPARQLTRDFRNWRPTPASCSRWRRATPRNTPPPRRSSSPGLLFATWCFAPPVRRCRFCPDSLCSPWARTRSRNLLPWCSTSG